MKFSICSIAILAVTTAVTVSAVDDHVKGMVGDAMTVFVANRAGSAPKVEAENSAGGLGFLNKNYHRGLQTEAECEAATEELLEDEDLFTAVVEYATNLLTTLFSVDFNTACVVTGQFITCEISDGGVEGEAALTSACSAAGGSIIEASGDLECDLVIDGESATVQYDLPTFIDCLPTTLNGTAIDCSSFVPELWNATSLQELETTLISSGFTSATCRSGALTTPSASFNRFAGGFVVFLGSALLFLLA